MAAGGETLHRLNVCGIQSTAFSVLARSSINFFLTLDEKQPSERLYSSCFLTRKLKIYEDLKNDLLSKGNNEI